MKARCCLCESHGINNRTGYMWIHMECLEKLMDRKEDLESIKELLEGNHPRNNDNADKLDVIVKFLADMEQFDRQWKNSMEAIKGVN